MRPNQLRRVAAVLAVGLLAGCGGGGSTGSGSEIPAGMGKMNIGVTDAPFPATEDCLAAALVEIDEVRLKGTGGWVDLAIDGGTASIDLLQLRSGLADLLATGLVPADTYKEVRLHVVRSVLVFSDGTPDRAFKIPSGGSSGIKIKIKPAFELTSGATADLLLDIDLAGSFKVRGVGCNPDCDDLKSGEGRVIFNPRIRAHHAPGTATGGGAETGSGAATVAAVSGTVLDATGAPAGAVLVMAYPAGFVLDGVTEPTAATFSASAGGVVAEGSYQVVLEPGSWDIYVQAPGANMPTVAVTLHLVGGDLIMQDLALP